MWEMRNTLWTRAAPLLACVPLAILVVGCGGGEDFKNNPRPPVPLQVTGVITEKRVTVSPNKFGAGPIVLNVSNLTEQSHTLTLDGEQVRERVGPINPQDVATIQKTLKAGHYAVRAGSAAAAPREIKPATLVVGPERPSAQDKLLLP
jgi:hypothetical protein